MKTTYTTPRRTVCVAELHDMRDPDNVGTRLNRHGKPQRWCRPCQRARHAQWRKDRRDRERQLEWTGPHYRTTHAWQAHRDKRGIANLRIGGRISYRITAVEQAALQHLADGLTYEETAQALYLSMNSLMRGVLYRVRLKYGVGSTAAAVAQGLKRGLIKPDRATAKLLRKNSLTRMHTRSVIRLAKGERPQYVQGGKALDVLLDTLCAWSEPHAVSVLWGAGLMTARHVPQTRNRYRAHRDQGGAHKESRAAKHALAS